MSSSKSRVGEPKFWIRVSRALVVRQSSEGVSCQMAPIALDQKLQRLGRGTRGFLQRLIESCYRSSGFTQGSSKSCCGEPQHAHDFISADGVLLDSCDRYARLAVNPCYLDTKTVTCVAD